MMTTTCAICPGCLPPKSPIDTYHLWQAMLPDGRYLLVTNDFSLSPTQMLSLYPSKDNVRCTSPV